MYSKICPQCNNQFTTKHKHTVCCSAQCAGLLRKFIKYEKVCQCCGKEFSNKRKEQKYCSKECQTKASIKNIHNCANCGKETIGGKSRKRNGELSENKFCSKECYSEFHKKQFTELVCDGCGKTYTKQTSLINPNKKKNYCSIDCTKQLKPLTCKVCGVLFSSIQYRKSNNEKGFTIIRPFRNTCSEKCVKEFYKIDEARKEKISFAFSGEKHPNFINGYSHNRRVRDADTKEFMSKRLRREILEKFNNQCFKCGSKERLTLDHHLPFTYGGRLTEFNTVVLCLSCNSKKNAKLPEKFYTKQELDKLYKLGIHTNNLFNLGC